MSDNYYGQFETDKIIEMYFPGQSGGHAVEVGGSDGVRGSNTLRFQQLGWRTILIEPNPDAVEVARNNGRHVIECACGSFNQSDVPFSIYDIGRNHITSSVSSLEPDKRLIEQHKDIIHCVKQITVDVYPLDLILAEAEFDYDIDFISIDTEGTELDVLMGLGLDVWNVRLLVVENNFRDKGVEEYLKQFGYHLDARWKINDFFLKEQND